MMVEVLNWEKRSLRPGAEGSAWGALGNKDASGHRLVDVRVYSGYAAK